MMQHFNPNVFFTGRLFELLQLKDYMIDKPHEILVVAVEDIILPSVKVEGGLPESCLELRKAWPEPTDGALDNTYYALLEIKDNLLLEGLTLFEVGLHVKLFRVPTVVTGSIGSWFVNVVQNAFAQKETTIRLKINTIPAEFRHVTQVGQSTLQSEPINN
jgi:hypothetical protein